MRRCLCVFLKLILRLHSLFCVRLFVSGLTTACREQVAAQSAVSVNKYSRKSTNSAGPSRFFDHWKTGYRGSISV